MLLKRLIICSILLVSTQTAFAKLILSAPPRENPKAGEIFYGPIAKKLSAILGEEVQYQHPKNWTRYASEMRQGRYDIVFDGPHFVAWRIAHVEHEPVARLAGNLQFYILANKADTKIKTMRDLIGSGLCGLASPNLGTVSAFNIYNNPIVQPQIHIIKGGMNNVMRQFLTGKCRAVVVRDKLYQKLTDSQKQTIRIIAKSMAMPNQTISVSKRVNKKLRTKIGQFLVSKSGAATADKLLERFSKKNKRFIPVKTSEFNGLEQLLEGVVFGW